jgi:Na+/proline symporter
MTNASVFGWFLIISPLTYLLGHYFFVGLIRNCNLNVKNCRTLSDLVYRVYPSRSIAVLITLMTASSYIMLVFLELYIGSVLFSIFLPQGILYQTCSFLILGVIVLAYVKIGGFAAIVQTDKIQLILMISSIAAVLVFSIISPANDNTVKQILINTTRYTSEGWFILLFSIWLTFINSIHAFGMVSNWQRLASSRDHDVSWRGLINSSWKVIFLLFATIVGFVVLNAKNYHVNNLLDFLYLVRDTGGISTFILFPMLIVGFASMVFSSADVALIAIGYSLADQNSFAKLFSRLKEEQLRKIISNATLVMLLILTVIYWLQFAVLQDLLLPLIYTISGQLAVLCPIPIFVLLQLKRDGVMPKIMRSKRKTYMFFSSIMTSWILLFIGAYLTRITQNQLWALLSMPIGAAVISVSILNILVTLQKKPRSF